MLPGSTVDVPDTTLSSFGTALGSVVWVDGWATVSVTVLVPLPGVPL